MQILGLIVIGIVIGILARLVLPGRQRIGAGLTVLLGIGGALGATSWGQAAKRRALANT